MPPTDPDPQARPTTESGYSLPARVGIVGCGRITAQYLPGIAAAGGIAAGAAVVAACADLDLSRAKEVAQKAGPGVRAMDVEDLLADPDVDIVLNLTFAAAHAEVNLAALSAGKSVYTEKPLALERSLADATVAAAAQRALRVGCAPDTFLGEGLQTCRRLVDEGAIGVPVHAVAELQLGGFHGNDSYLQWGAGPLWDFGPYYLTALVSMLGGIRTASATARFAPTQRSLATPERRGATIVDVEVPTHLSAVLEFDSGALGGLTLSVDMGGHYVPRLVLHGTEGSLWCPDPNGFGGPVRLARGGDWEEVALDRPGGPVFAKARGFGLAEMARAIAEGRPHRADGRMGAHVVEVMEACCESSRTGSRVSIESRCERPEPLPPAG